MNGYPYRFIVGLLFLITIHITFVQSLPNLDIAFHSDDLNSTYNNGELIIVEAPVADTKYWHWYHYKHRIRNIQNEEDECVRISSIGDFPADLFTQQQRLHGAIILHLFAVVYFFTLSGIVINNYFIPAVQCICDDLKITPDVGAAVFMATATATPELFTNSISTFIADSDMGIGTVIGSLMFNVLGVAAVSSFATRKPRRMDWWPITRDTVIFIMNVSILVIFTWDGTVFWWEALILLLFIIFYYTVMFQSRKLGIFMKRKFEDDYRCCNRNNYDLEKPYDPKAASTPSPPPTVYERKSSLFVVSAEKNPDLRKAVGQKIIEKKLEQIAEDEANKKHYSLFRIPTDSKLKTAWFFYSWPIKFLCTFTMPNPKTYRKLYPLTFLICIVWIGLNSYMIFWMLIVVGYTFAIPESVLGLTVLAVGGCTPELITGYIMAKKGQSGTGVANSLGASSLGILLSLGLPWLLSAAINGGAMDKPFVTISNYGMQYLILSLVFVGISLYTVVALSRFTLRKLTGLALGICYMLFITFAVLVETDLLFPSGHC